MCGITGKIFFDSSKSIDESELNQMTDSLYHRGPDDRGIYLNNNIGLGFRRLSIIDIKAGHQPLCDQSGNFWITFNGEIYNYIELRKILIDKGYKFRTNSDTEVIINMFIEYKENCLHYLRGMFSFVIWDNDKKVLFGARDRFGIKPFHYYIDNDKFIWGSEIKSILASNLQYDLNIEALDSYFAYGYILKEKTIFKQIRKLLPGNYFILSLLEKEKFRIKQYWEINYEPDYSKTEEYWKEQIYNTLNEAVKIRLMSDVPLGAFLSGGIDSSIIVALMAKNSSSRVKTFSLGFKELKYNELNYAREIAEMYNTDHHEFIVEPESISLLPKLVKSYDEPYADSSSIPTYYVSKYTREHVTVALSGDGGDELFLGYDLYTKIQALHKLKFIHKNFFKCINKILPEHFYGKGLTYYLSKDSSSLGAYFCIWKEDERKKIFNSDVYNMLNIKAEEQKILYLDNVKNLDYINKWQYIDLKTYLVDDILTKVDRASMVNSLEVRVPLLDHKFAELSFKIPSELKLLRNEKKYILKESFKHILPKTVLNHSKHGFSIPLDIWFRGNLKEYVFDNIQNSRYLSSYLNMKYVNQILENHLKGQRDFSYKIWTLLFLNEWLKQNK